MIGYEKKYSLGNIYIPGLSEWVACHSLEQGTQEERGGAVEVSIGIFQFEVSVRPQSGYVSPWFIGDSGSESQI